MDRYLEYQPSYSKHFYLQYQASFLDDASKLTGLILNMDTLFDVMVEVLWLRDLV
jgi:hypothetical protein